MKKNSIEFLKTACFIRTKQFIDQEFERYAFMHRYQKQLNDLNELNQLEGVTWGRFYCHINKNVIECSGEE